MFESHHLTLKSLVDYHTVYGRNPAPLIRSLSHYLQGYVCKASRKWHTSKSQPPFTCWLRCVKFWFQNTVCWGSPPSTRNLCRSTRAVWSGDPLWPTRPPEPLHHCLKRNGIKRKRINPSLPLPWQRHRLPQGGANVFWIQDPPFPKKGHRWVSMLSCHRAVSPASRIFGIRASLWK